MPRCSSARTPVRAGRSRASTPGSASRTSPASSAWSCPGPGAVCYLRAGTRAPCSGGDAAAAAAVTDPLADTAPPAAARGHQRRRDGHRPHRRADRSVSGAGRSDHRDAGSRHHAGSQRRRTRPGTGTHADSRPRRRHRPRRRRPARPSPRPPRAPTRAGSPQRRPRADGARRAPHRAALRHLPGVDQRRGAACDVHGRHQGREPARAPPPSQQVTEQALPARRGAILDRNGAPLAISEPADDISATPYLVKDPVKAAAQIAPLLGVSEAQVTKALARRDTGFVYLARRVPARGRRRDQEARHRRDRPHAGIAAHLPAQHARLAGDRRVGLDGNGLFGLEYAHDKVLHGRDGEQRSVLDGGRQRIEVQDVRRSVPGERVRLTLDAQLQERTEEVLQGVGADLPSQGRDGDRDGSAHRRDPLDGQLAADRRQRPRLRTRVGAAEPRRRLRPTSRARRSRPSPSPARSRRARSRRTRRSTSRRRSRSPTA